MHFDLEVSKGLLDVPFLIILFLEIRRGSFRKWRDAPGAIQWSRPLYVVAGFLAVSLVMVLFDESLLRVIQSADFPGKDGLSNFGGFLGSKNGVWLILYIGYFIAYFLGYGLSTSQSLIRAFGLRGHGIGGVSLESHNHAGTAQPGIGQ